MEKTQKIGGVINLSKGSMLLVKLVGDGSSSIRWEYIPCKRLSTGGTPGDVEAEAEAEGKIFSTPELAVENLAGGDKEARAIMMKKLDEKLEGKKKQLLSGPASPSSHKRGMPGGTDLQDSEDSGWGSDIEAGGDRGSLASSPARSSGSLQQGAPTGDEVAATSPKRVKSAATASKPNPTTPPSRLWHSSSQQDGSHAAQQQLQPQPQQQQLASGFLSPPGVLPQAEVAKMLQAASTTAAGISAMNKGPAPPFSAAASAGLATHPMVPSTVSGSPGENGGTPAGTTLSAPGIMWDGSSGFHSTPFAAQAPSSRAAGRRFSSGSRGPWRGAAHNQPQAAAAAGLQYPPRTQGASMGDSLSGCGAQLPGAQGTAAGPSMEQLADMLGAGRSAPGHRDAAPLSLPTTTASTSAAGLEHQHFAGLNLGTAQAQGAPLLGSVNHPWQSQPAAAPEAGGAAAGTWSIPLLNSGGRGSLVECHGADASQLHLPTATDLHTSTTTDMEGIEAAPVARSLFRGAGSSQGISTPASTGFSVPRPPAAFPFKQHDSSPRSLANNCTSGPTCAEGSSRSDMDVCAAYGRGAGKGKSFCPIPQPGLRLRTPEHLPAYVSPCKGAAGAYDKLFAAGQGIIQQQAVVGVAGNQGPTGSPEQCWYEMPPEAALHQQDTRHHPTQHAREQQRVPGGRGGRSKGHRRAAAAGDAGDPSEPGSSGDDEGEGGGHQLRRGQGGDQHRRSRRRHRREADEGSAGMLQGSPESRQQLLEQLKAHHVQGRQLFKQVQAEFLQVQHDQQQWEHDRQQWQQEQQQWQQEQQQWQQEQQRFAEIQQQWEDEKQQYLQEKVQADQLIAALGRIAQADVGAGGPIQTFSDKHLQWAPELLQFKRLLVVLDQDTRDLLAAAAAQNSSVSGQVDVQGLDQRGLDKGEALHHITDRLKSASQEAPLCMVVLRSPDASREGPSLLQVAHAEPVGAGGLASIWRCWLHDEAASQQPIQPTLLKVAARPQLVKSTTAAMPGCVHLTQMEFEMLQRVAGSRAVETGIAGCCYVEVDPATLTAQQCEEAELRLLQDRKAAQLRLENAGCSEQEAEAATQEQPEAGGATPRWFLVFAVYEMEEYAGDLSEMTSNGRLLMELEVLCGVGHIAEGVCVMHAAGIIHRDLKLANIMLAEKRAHHNPANRHKALALRCLTSFAALLADFNLGSARGCSTDASGTRGFWAPEQARGEEHGPKADIFAFGIILIELAFGRAARQQWTENLPRDRQPNPELPERAWRNSTHNAVFLEGLAAGWGKDRFNSDTEDEVVECLQGTLAFEPAARWSTSDLMRCRLVARARKLLQRIQDPDPREQAAVQSDFEESLRFSMAINKHIQVELSL